MRHEGIMRERLGAPPFPRPVATHGRERFYGNLLQEGGRKRGQTSCLPVVEALRGVPVASSSPIARINAFAKEHGRQNVSVFFRGQLLELMRWTCLLSSDQSDDGDTFNRQESRLAFVRVALLASEVWFRRVYRDRMRSDGPIHEV